MRIAEEFAEAAVVAAVFVLALDGGKFCAQDEDRPEDCDYSGAKARIIFCMLTRR
jgi:hypothetical protein